MFGRKSANILVIKSDGLSEFVSAEPAFAAIRDAHQGATISLLTSPELQRVARASPFFDQVAAMPDAKDASAWREFVKQLKNVKVARVYDLCNTADARRLHSAMGPFRPKWHMAGAAPKKPRIKGDLRSAAPDLSKALAEARIEAPNRLPDFHWALEARKDSANMKPSWYGITGPFGLLLPGSVSGGRWSADGYAGLAKLMSTAGIMPVLAGPKILHDFGDAIADTAPQLIDLAGKTDHLQLAALAHEASFFVSDHAGEMDLAVSVGCEGVLVASGACVNAKAPEGRHVVTLTAHNGPESVDSVFVWQTLTNMGLTAQTADQNDRASVR